MNIITKITTILSLLAILSLPACTPTTIKPDGSVSDQSVIQQINQENYWQYFETEDGSKLKEVVFARTEKPAAYLRSCGGLSPQFFVLTDEKDQTIATKDAFLKKINHLKNPAEAVAYLYATQCGISNSFGNAKQFVNITPDGYQVAVIHYSFFGCGVHTHRQRVFSVTLNGEVKMLQETKLEAGKEFCGD